MQINQSNRYLSQIQGEANAMAYISGSADMSALQGKVAFYQMLFGVLVVADICGLPDGGGSCNHPVFAMHIHEGGACSGDINDPYKNSGGHYNPESCRHPQHAGDLPPLFSNKGCAWYAVLTDRFAVRDVIGRTVIVHRGVDDFASQPSGNAGEKIGCGVIVSNKIQLEPKPYIR